MADTENNKNFNSPAERAQGNAPALRFTSFTEPWQRMTVSDLLEFYSTNSLSWEQLSKDTESEFMNLHYGLIHVGLPTIVNIEENKLPYIKEDAIPRNYVLCENGDVSFADASEDTSEVAKAIEFTGIGNEKVISGLHTIHGRDKQKKTIVGFKGYLFSSEAFHKQTRRIAQGSKVFSISPRNFSEIFVSIPSKEEQRKIAELLLLLDERIATQRRLIDKLETLIKGIAELLTTSTPNTKITDCLVCHSSTLQENQVVSSGKYRVYGASGICGYTDLPDVTDDSILIVKDGSGVGTVAYASGKYSVIGTSNYLTEKNGYLLKYIYYCLKFFNFTPYKTGMAIPHIYFKDYGKAKIYCPSIEEQMNIAAVLSNIECKIEIEQTMLKQYTIQKQCLLQQMFI